MQPEICRFPPGKLQNGAHMEDKSAPFHETKCLGPYIFFDVTDGQERLGRYAASQSVLNESEASAAAEILKFLSKRYPSELRCKKIGIITPYRSQLSLLRSKFSSIFGPEAVSDMELNTVDGFQGREVDIRLLSTVRASSSGGNLMLNGKKPDVAKTAKRNASITMKQKLEELLQEPYMPVHARWTTEMCEICQWIEDWDYNKIIICNRKCKGCGRIMSSKNKKSDFDQRLCKACSKV